MVHTSLHKTQHAASFSKTRISEKMDRTLIIDHLKNQVLVKYFLPLIRKIIMLLLKLFYGLISNHLSLGCNFGPSPLIPSTWSFHGELRQYLKKSLPKTSSLGLHSLLAGSLQMSNKCYKIVHQSGQGRGDLQRSSNTMKAYMNA